MNVVGLLDLALNFNIVLYDFSVKRQFSRLWTIASVCSIQHSGH